MKRKIIAILIGALIIIIIANLLTNNILFDQANNIIQKQTGLTSNSTATCIAGLVLLNPIQKVDWAYIPIPTFTSLIFAFILFIVVRRVFEWRGVFVSRLAYLLVFAGLWLLVKVVGFLLAFFSGDACLPLLPTNLLGNPLTLVITGALFVLGLPLIFSVVKKVLKNE